MATPRKAQIILSQTKHYHCMIRCVRQARICGFDKFSGQNYEHRRKWIESRLFRLAKVFTIEICAYAIMHNHAHFVLHVDDNLAYSLDRTTILKRWSLIHKLTPLQVTYLCKGTSALTDDEKSKVYRDIEFIRLKLFSIAWFMKDLNQYIAVKANKEDGCVGKFWESRYKSQALLDERALLACMVYVDLNPIRAGIASSLEQSHYTSIQKRVLQIKSHWQPTQLKPLTDKRSSNSRAIPMDLKAYIQVVTETSGMVYSPHDKVIQFPLSQLGFAPTEWRKLTSKFESLFGYVVGASDALIEFKQHVNLSKIRGMGAANEVFLNTN